MKVLVCGGRDFNDVDWLESELDYLDSRLPERITLVIEGGAKGADSIAGRWADFHKINHLRVPAKWDKYGKSAGYKRNAEMLTFEPDYVLAFPGGKGTKMMCELARKEGVFVKELADVAK